MDMVFPYAAAIDIGKKKSLVCLQTPQHKQLRTIAMMTEDLLALADWLAAHKVTHIAMESTGAYWKPLYNVLEAYDFDLWLVNARDVKNVPGRKTDVKDAEWLVDLLRHGLLKRSFVPERAQRELREVVRYRRKLIEERTREFNRLEKSLEGANIKLGAVASTLTGKSVRRMLWAIVEGQEDPEPLADLALGRLKDKRPALIKALRGFVGDHVRFMLSEQLGHLDELDGRIERLSAEIAERLRPFEAELARLETMPGWGRRTAEEVTAEIGFDMSRFASAAHLSSWGKMAPGNNESAGKRKSGRTGKGNRYLRCALVEAARAAGRRKGTYLHAQYHRLSARRGKKRAAVAVGHTMLVIAYHILRDGTAYQDLGANYFDERKETRVVARLQRRLERLGYAVSLSKQAA